MICYWSFPYQKVLGPECMAIAMDVAVFPTVKGGILDAFAELNQSTASFILPLIKTLLEDRHHIVVVIFIVTKQC